jgi:hypothetical protein
MEAPVRTVMEAKSATFRWKMPELTRQLPITKSAHKATVIGDALVPAVRAGLDMTAEGGGAAVLDRRHDLELLQAQVSGMSGTIGGTGVPQDVGDLERGAHRLSWRACPLACCLWPQASRACRAG